ncbi:hypothetical protein OAT97_00630 [Gammaproteobacteria bacterium]|nr:hypothetical protein [Gammaproteobacteria bacterium]
MQIYLVGGAVRDKLLGLIDDTSKCEQDWLVVGATPEQMIKLGYKRVGKDFPVFLHPKTKQEYALARTERKTALGHRGFTVHSSLDVSLEEDVKRRDLTINAIAQDKNEKLLDHVGGLHDIQHKILRHITDSFCEDPLRILRLARFLAKLHHLGFRVAPQTQELVIYMLHKQKNDIISLSAARIFRETLKALETQQPHIYFDFLLETGALEVFIPILHKAYAANKSILQRAASLTYNTLTRLSILTLNLSGSDLDNLKNELNLPRSFSKHLTYIQYARQYLSSPLSADNILDMIVKCSLKLIQNLQNLSTSLQVLTQLEMIDENSIAVLDQAIIAINNLDNSWIQDSNYCATQIQEKVYEYKLAIATKVLEDMSNNKNIAT